MKNSVVRKSWAVLLSLGMGATMMSTPISAMADVFDPNNNEETVTQQDGDVDAASQSSVLDTDAPLQQNDDPDPDPNTVYGIEADQEAMLTAIANGSEQNARMARGLSTRMAVDPSDKNQWYIYDHSNLSITSAWTDMGYNTTIHPHQYVSDNHGNKTVTTWQDALNISNVAYMPHHIWTNGSSTGAEILYQGYGVPGYSDFMLYRTTSAETKGIRFDVDMKRIGAHTLAGFGIMINGQVAGGQLTSYLIYFNTNGSYNQGSTGKIYLVKVNENAISFSNGKASFSSGNGVIQLSTAGAKEIGTFASGAGNKYTIDMEVDTNNFVAKIGKYNGTKQPVGNEFVYLQDSTGNKNIALDAGTGYGFGTFVDYISHGCSQLSTVLFSNMSMSDGYSVIFDPNGGTMTSPERYDGIKPGTSMNGSQVGFPTNPTRPGYVFQGWELASGGSFNADYVLTKGTGTAIWSVVAKWQEVKNGSSVSYTPTGQTKTDVTSTVTFESNLTVTQIVDKNGNKVDFTDNGDGTYTITQTFDKNGDNKFTMTSKDPVSGAEFTTSQEVKVDWIDKLAPVVTKQPNSGDKVEVDSFTWDDANATTEYFKSGKDDSSSKWVATPVGGGQPVEATTWEALFRKLPDGNYDISYTLSDNVGNTTPGSVSNVLVSRGPSIDIKEEQVSPQANENGYYNTSPSIPFEGIADKDLGIKEIIVTKPDRTEQNITGNGTASQTGNFTADQDGDYTVTIVDKNGNKNTDTIHVNLDKTKPSITLPTDPNELDKIGFTDPAGTNESSSGIDNKDKIITVIDKETGNKVAEGPIDKVLEDLPSGNYDVTITVTDKAGNKSDPETITDMSWTDKNAKIDVTVTYDTHKWTNNDVIAEYTIKSPVKIATVTINGTSMTDYTSSDGGKTVKGKRKLVDNKSLDFEVTTVNKNLGSKGDIETPWIDKKAPVININEAVGLTKTTASVYDAPATDQYAKSDIATQTYKLMIGTTAIGTYTSMEAAYNAAVSGKAYTLVVDAMDKAGNPASKTTTKNIYKDNVKVVVAPNVIITGGDAMLNKLTTKASLSFRVSNIAFSYTLKQGATVRRSGTGVAGGTVTIPLSICAKGATTLTVTPQGAATPAVTKTFVVR